MSVYIMMSMLVISTNDCIVAIELSQLQGFELVDKGLQKDGGIAEFYLKNKADSIVFAVHKKKDWKELKTFINKSLISIARYTNQSVIIKNKEEVPF